MKTCTVLVLLLAAGCMRDHHDLPPVELTPMGLRVYVPPGAAEKFGHDNALLWADHQVLVWIQEKHAWGMEAYTDEEMWAFARSLPIIGYDGNLVPGDGRIPYNGWTWYYNHIQIAVYLPGVFAENVQAYGFTGYSNLPHEFTHVARGNFHP